MLFLKKRVEDVKNTSGKLNIYEQGKVKKSETFINSIRSIIRIRGNFGKVYTNFGKPVFLNKVLDQLHPEWNTEKYNDSLKRSMVLGHEGLYPFA